MEPNSITFNVVFNANCVAVKPYDVVSVRAGSVRPPRGVLQYYTLLSGTVLGSSDGNRTGR